MRVLLFVVRCLLHWHRITSAWVRVCLLVSCQLFALANVGCASSSLAARFPQARVEPVCVRISGIEYDANHWVYTSDGRAVSNFDADAFAHVASQPGAIIFTFDGEAPRDSANRLPAPDNQIDCHTGFSWLPSAPVEEPSPNGCRGTCQLPPGQVVSLGEGPLRAQPGEGYSSGTTPPRGPWIAQQAGGTNSGDPAPRAADSRATQIWGGFAAGAAIGSVPLGSVGAQVATDAGRLPKGTRDARVGKAAGELAVGGAHIILGVAGFGGSAALSATGIGAPGGVAAGVVSATMVASGVVTVSMGAAHMIDAVRSPDDAGYAQTATPPATNGAAGAGTSVGSAAKPGTSGTNGGNQVGTSAAAQAATARTTTVVKPKTTTRTRPKQNPNGKHGNSADGDGPQHGYIITDTKRAKPVKVGQSGGQRTPDGGSTRANDQVRKWDRQAKEPGRYKAEVVKEVPAGPGAKRQILKWERDTAERLREEGHLRDPKKHQVP